MTNIIAETEYLPASSNHCMGIPGSIDDITLLPTKTGACVKIAPENEVAFTHTGLAPEVLHYLRG